MVDRLLMAAAVLLVIVLLGSLVEYKLHNNSKWNKASG